MSTFSDLVDQVRADANKGSSLDSALANRVAMAIQWIEQNYTFEYMKRFITFYIEANSAEPGPYVIPTNLKAMLMVRQVTRGLDQGITFRKLQKIDPRQEAGWSRGTPQGYWLDGMQWIWFDAVPSERLEMQAYVARYTGVPIPDSYSNWLVDNGYQAILAKTMQLLASYARQPGWIELYRPMLDQGIQALILADEQQQMSDTEERFGSASYGG